MPSALPLNRRYRTKTHVLSPMICSSSDLTSGGSNELNCHFRVHQNMWSSNPLFMIFHLLAQFHPKCRTHIACFFCTTNTLSPCNHSLEIIIQWFMRIRRSNSRWLSVSSLAYPQIPAATLVHLPCQHVCVGTRPAAASFFHHLSLQPPFSALGLPWTPSAEVTSVVRNSQSCWPVIPVLIQIQKDP